MVKESQGSEKMVMLETEHSTLNKIIGKKISIEKLEEILFNLGFELEDVQGDNIKIDVTTERPDLLSTYGLGRTLRAYLGRKNNSYKIPKSGEKLKVNDAAKEWPCAVACIVKGLKFDNEKIKEVIRIQEKLGDTFLRNRKKGGIGIYPLDKIKFPVRFTAEIPEKIKFTPLESKNLMNAHKILEEHPTGRKYKHIIEEWKKFPIFIDTNDNIMSMPPIINSHNLGKIDEKTKDVFVEATGQDLKTINMALQVLAAALIDMGGKAYSIDMIYGNKTVTSPNFYEEKRTLKVQAVNKILGLDLKANEIKKLLEKMSYKVEWAAKWWTFGVTIEGAGKDHASAGGTYDVAKKILKDVFEKEPPLAFAYEFFLTGGKKMSSSKGLGLTGQDLLEVLPSQLVRFLMIKTPPNQAIEFNPRSRDIIPRIYDDYQQAQAKGDVNHRAFEFSQIGEKEKIPEIRFLTLTQWVQMPNMQDRIREEGLENWAKYAKVWVEKYAPDDVKFEIQKKIPKEVERLSKKQKAFLRKIAKELNKKWEAEEFQRKLYEWAKELGISSNEAFQALYLSIIGKDHGPKAGWLILEYKEFVQKRFMDISSV